MVPATVLFSMDGAEKGRAAAAARVTHWDARTAGHTRSRAGGPGHAASIALSSHAS